MSQIDHTEYLIRAVERCQHDRDHATTRFGTLPGVVVVDPLRDVALLELSDRQSATIAAEVIEPA